MNKKKTVIFDDSELSDNADFDIEALIREIEEEEAAKQKENNE